MRRLNRNVSLKKTSYIIDALLIIFIILISYMIYVNATERIVMQLDQERENRVHSMIGSIDNYILSEMNNLQIAASMVERTGLQWQDRKNFLARVQYLQALYHVNRRQVIGDFYYLRNESGAMDFLDLSGTGMARYLREVQDTQKPLVTPVYSSVITGKETFSFIFPHYSGVMVGEIDISALFTLIQRTGLIRLHPESIILLLKADSKQVLYRSSPEKYPYWEFRGGPHEEAAINDVRYHYLEQIIQSLKLHLVILTPYKVYHESSSIIRYYFISLVVLVIGFYFIRIFWINKSFFAPLYEFLGFIKDKAVSSLVLQSRYAEWKVLETTYNDAIDKMKEAEKELEMAHGYLGNVFDSMPSLLVGVDKDGMITQWNRAAHAMTGVSAGDALRRPFWEVTGLLKRYRKYFEKIMQDGMEVQLRREVFNEGEISYHDVTLFPIAGDGSSGIVIRIDNTTELEKKDLQLRQAQKMETVGSLAGGLAHDFNNVLGGIIGAISLLKLKFAKLDVQAPDIERYLSLLDESSQRAADMVQQLLTLTRKQELVLVPVDLNEAVRHVLKVCQSSFDKSVTVSAEYCCDTAVIRADLTQMEQVLLNLCVNGYHAMTLMRGEGEPQGGELRVDVHKRFADDRFCATHPESESRDYWVISVSDTGVGIDATVAAKIFDPFFTTKDKGTGTGLGLSVTYNIIRQHRGFIDLYSEIGEGSTFTVYLPAATDSLSEIKESPGSAELPRGSGLVLVIDDEDIMRQSAQSILEECGYRVILAGDGEEGVRLYKENRDDVTLVLLDMVMPKKSGKEAFMELKAFDPSVKVILSSGFRQDDRVSAIINMGVAGFLQKPYTAAKLAEAVHQVLYGV